MVTRAPHSLGWVLAFVCVMLAGLTGPARAVIPGEDFSALAERLSDSVVNIASTRGAPGAPQTPGRGPRSLGSGFIIDPSGLIVTNEHVIREAANITVFLFDGTALQARLMAKSARTDIALLKVDAGRQLPAVSFGNSDEAKVGSWALAIGNPFGFGGSVTLGIVSARDRNIKNRQAPGLPTGRPQYFDFFIQTDAAINSGNSGGPLFNAKGEVIGINTAIISPDRANVGLAFAIPSSFAAIVVNQLREYGEARLGYLGVSVQAVDQNVAQRFALSSVRGVIVTDVRPNSPAQRGGLLPGDIILTYEGLEVNAIRRLPRLVARTPVGRAVPLKVWRGGQEITLSVTIEALPTQGGAQQRLSIAPPEPRRFAGIGVTLSELSLPMKIERGMHAADDGLLVISVDPDSPMAGRLEPGDMITDVQGNPVKDMLDMEDTLEQAGQKSLGALLVKVNRGEKTLYEAFDLRR